MPPVLSDHSNKMPPPPLHPSSSHSSRSAGSKSEHRDKTNKPAVAAASSVQAPAMSNPIPPPPPPMSQPPPFHSSHSSGVSNSTTSMSTNHTPNTKNGTTTTSLHAIKHASLHGNLMRRQFRDPMSIYELVEELGQGSMGCVSKVRKRDHAIGGSANPQFLQQQNRCCFPLLSWFQQLLPSSQGDIMLSRSDHHQHLEDHGGTNHNIVFVSPGTKTESTALSSISWDAPTNSEHSQQQQQDHPLQPHKDQHPQQQRSLWDDPLDHDNKDDFLLTLTLSANQKQKPPPKHQHCRSLTSLPSSLMTDSITNHLNNNSSTDVHPLKRPPRLATPPVPRRHGKPTQTTTTPRHGHRKTSSALIRYNTTTTMSLNNHNSHSSSSMDNHKYHNNPRTTRSDPAAYSNDSSDDNDDSVASPIDYWQAHKRESVRQIAAADLPPRRKDVWYALKTIHLSQCTSNVFRKELINEVEILKEMDHPNIARAIETFVHKERLYVTLELCSGGDLYARDPYTEQQAGKILQSLFSAVSYLHFKGIVHRDLKYENIMFVDTSPDAEVKLIDFGLSKKYAGGGFMKEKVGTIYTMAPELLGGKYDAKADVWSLGVIAFMLLSSSMPFHGKTRVRIMQKILKERPSYTSERWENVSKQARHFLDIVLEKDPKLRPTAERGMKLVNTWLYKQGFWKPPEPPISSTTPCADPFSSQPPPPSCEVPPDVERLDRIQASIQAFAQYRLLKKLVLMVVAYKSTTEEIGFLRSMFGRFDARQTGVISRDDFTDALLAVYEYTPEEIGALFDALDVGGSGTVGYSEFLAATLEAHGLLEEDRLAEAFDRIDSDDTGYITVDNLRDFLGKDLPLHYLETIMDEAGLSQDRRIYYGEFLDLWNEQDDMTLKRAKQQVQVRRHHRSLSNCDSLVSNVSSFREDDPSSMLGDQGVPNQKSS